LLAESGNALEHRVALGRGHRQRGELAGLTCSLTVIIAVSVSEM
jgi:hypothetical protein